jgi:hypothetical protein
MKLKYIKTMDFMFENIEVVNAIDIDCFMSKIKRGEVIEILNEGDKEYINSSYIMYFG